MKAIIRVCAMLFLAAGCAPRAVADLEPGSIAIGRWSAFYSLELKDGRLDYLYDRSRVLRSADHVVSRWKVLGSREATTALYVVDISCRDGTFTEKGTVILDAQGRAKTLPQSELFIARSIEKGTSADVFRRKFCGK